MDTQGSITQIRQDGWVIDYLQYMSDVPSRPRKLTIARNGLEIRLVIDTWELE